MAEQTIVLEPINISNKLPGPDNVESFGENTSKGQLVPAPRTIAPEQVSPQATPGFAQLEQGSPGLQNLKNTKNILTSPLVQYEQLKKDMNISRNPSDQFGTEEIPSAGEFAQRTQTKLGQIIPPDLAIPKSEIENNIGKAAGEVITQGVAGATLGASEDLLNTLQDIGRAADKFANMHGVGKGDLFSDKDFSFAEDLVPPSNNWYGQMARSTGQFIAPFMTGSALLNLSGEVNIGLRLAKAASIGAVSNFIDTNKAQGNLSNLVQKFPSLSNWVSAGLAINPSDSNMLARWKNAGEGLGLGALGELIATGVQGLNKTLSLTAGEALKPTEEVGAGTPPSTPLADNKGTKIEPDAKATPENKWAGKFLNPEDFSDMLLNLKNPTKTIPGEERIRQTLDEVNAANLAKARGFKPDEEVLQNVLGKFKDVEDVSKLTPNDLEKMFPKASEETEKILAAKISYKVIAKDAWDKIQNVHIGDEASMGEALEAAQHSIDFGTWMEGYGSEKGRSFRMMGGYVKLPDELRGKQLSGLVQLYGGPQQAFRSLKQLQGLGEEGLSGVAKSQQSTINNRILETYINSKLTLRSLAIKPLADATMIPLYMAQTAGAAAIGKAAEMVGGNAAATQIGQVGAQIHGLMNGLADLFHLSAIGVEPLEMAPAPKALYKKNLYTDAMGALRKDSVQDVLAKTISSDQPGDKAIEVMAHMFSDNHPQLSDYYHDTVTLPSKAIMSIDDAFKSVNYRIKVHELAYQEAFSRGLTGPDAENFITGIIKDPATSLGPIHGNDLQMTAMAHAQNQTFSKVGGLGDQVSHAIDSMALASRPVRILQKMLFPFISTDMNQMEHAIQAAPVASMLLDGVRNDLSAGGIRREMALSKMSLGGTALAMGTVLAHGGNISPSLPTNYAQAKWFKDLGIQPDSFLIGDKYYSADKLGPISRIIKLSSNFAAFSGMLPDVNKADFDKLFWGAAATIGHAYMPESLVSDMSNFLQAVSDPNSHAGKLITKNIGEGLLPLSGTLRSLRKIEDPNIRDTANEANDTWENLYGFVDHLKNLVPGYSKDGSVVKNLFGMTVQPPPGYGWEALSPVYTNVPIKSAGLDELQRLHLVTMPMKISDNEGQPIDQISYPGRILKKNSVSVPLSNKQYQEYVELSGGNGLNTDMAGSMGMPKGTYPTLKEALDYQVSNNYPALAKTKFTGDDAKKIVLSSIVGAYQKAARAQLLQTSEIQTPVQNTVEQRIKSLQGTE